MNRFYFTYGTSKSMPFQGGWTEVIAETIEQAIALFNAVHEPYSVNIINCAGIYTEEEFKKTAMYEMGSNLGYKLRESIEIKRYE